MSRTEKLRRAFQRLAAMIAAFVRALFGGLDRATDDLGDALGALRQPGTPSAEAIADEGVATDGTDFAPPRTDLGPVFMHAAAEAFRHGGRAELRKYDPYVPPPVQDWLASLSPQDLDVAIRLDPAVLYRHAFAELATQCTPLLPPPLHLQPDREDELDRMIARAKRNLAASAKEVAAMATRGPRPAVLPTHDDEDEPDYGQGLRPAFH